MSDFLHQITTLSWWLGVVVVGIAINLISAWLPKVYSRISKIYLENIEKKKALEDLKQEKEINLQVQHPERLVFYIYDEISKELSMWGGAMMTIALGVIGSLELPAPVGSFFIFLSVLFLFLTFIILRIVFRQRQMIIYVKNILENPSPKEEFKSS